MAMHSGWVVTQVSTYLLTKMLQRFTGAFLLQHPFSDEGVFEHIKQHPEIVSEFDGFEPCFEFPKLFVVEELVVFLCHIFPYTPTRMAVK